MKDHLKGNASEYCNQVFNRQIILKISCSSQFVAQNVFEVINLWFLKRRQMDFCAKLPIIYVTAQNFKNISSINEKQHNLKPYKNNLIETEAQISPSYDEQTQKNIVFSPCLVCKKIISIINVHIGLFQIQILQLSMLKQKKSIVNNLFRTSEQILTQSEKTKCKEKFESYKALGSTMLSKNELRKVIREMGREISEQDLLEMIYEADPNGHGFISDKAFEKIIANFKLQKEEKVINPISLAFDEILRSYQRKNPTKHHQNVPWNHIQQYLSQNFGLAVNLKNFKHFNNSKTELNCEDFKYMFS